jgi:predicted dehydrogenase
MIILGQIGIGAWGKNHLRSFSSLGGCRIKSCCDKDKKVLEGISLDYKNEIAVTQSPEDMFSDKDITGVIIATLPDSHARLAIRAMESGKHVFVEKPLAMSVREGMDIKEASKKYGKICMVGHILLYHPAVVTLKKYTEDGYLGDIYYIYSTRVNLGKIRKEENALWSLTSHDISVVMYMLGEEPFSVSAAGSSYIQKGIHDVVFVNMNFSGNRTAHIHASWLDPHKIRQFTIVGSKKMAIFDDMSREDKLKIYDKGVDRTDVSGSYESFLTLRSGDIFSPKIDMQEPLKIEGQAFLDAINNGCDPLASVDNGIAVLKVLETAQRSLDEGGTKIKIPKTGAQ